MAKPNKTAGKVLAKMRAASGFKRTVLTTPGLQEIMDRVQRGELSPEQGADLVRALFNQPAKQS